MSNTKDLVFSELYLPRPLAASAVTAFVTRLATDQEAGRIVLEARAEQGTVRFLLGCRATDIPRTRHLLGNLIPGALMNGLTTPRSRFMTARQLRLHPKALPLNIETSAAVAPTILTALTASKGPGEALALQIVFGPRLAPRFVPAKITSATAPWWEPLTGNETMATPEERSRRRQRDEQHGIQASIRLGVNSSDSGRRARLATGLFSALRLLQAPGQSMQLTYEKPAHIDDAMLPFRWPLRLSAEEAAAFLAWPIGEEDLPGIAPTHPKQLRAASAVHSGNRTFATSTVPGDSRKLGISAPDALMHLIAYGPTGSGKSTALEHLIAADIAAGLPVIVIDPKKQLAIDSVTRHIPSERLNDVVALDASSPNPVGFNPLAVTDGRDPDVIADGVLAVFKTVFHEGWGPRTEDIYSACLRTLTRTSTAENPATLMDIPRLLTDPAFRRPRVGQLQSDPGLAGFWAWYDNLSPNAQASAVAAPFNKLRQLLLRPSLVRMLGQPHPQLNLRNFFQEKKIVLVPLNEGLIGEGTASLLGSLVIAELWQATQERATEKNPQKHPGMIYVDEAHRFLHLPVSLADALNQSRSLGVGWHLATQYQTQFPAEVRDAISTNARSKIVFAQEPDDAKYFARKARQLTEEDFTELPKYHAYVNLVAGGSPSGWASVATLPPRPPVSDTAAVLAASNHNYQPALAPAQEDSAVSSPAIETAPLTAPPPAQAGPVGRKRRRP